MNQCLFVIFLLVMVLSVLHLMTSDYPLVPSNLSCKENNSEAVKMFHFYTSIALHCFLTFFYLTFLYFNTSMSGRLVANWLVNNITLDLTPYGMSLHVSIPLKRANKLLILITIQLLNML